MSALDDQLLGEVHTLHDEVRRAVAECLSRARATGRGEVASAPGEDGAGDLSYAIDEVAHEPLRGFVDRVGRSRAVRMVAEGPGELVHPGPPEGAREPLAVLVDPIDGTRPLMHDMRSGWMLTGLAPDRGDATRLADIELAVQTELPTTTAGTYRVLAARRGQGATEALHDVRTGELLELRPLAVSEGAPLANGYFAFTRFLPMDLMPVAELEQRFLQRALPALGIESRLFYPDQLLCVAGQLHLLATGSYRMLADLRGWLGDRHGIGNFTCKPYDLATALIFEEAGVPVLDAQGEPLDAPFDTETRLDVVAYGNQMLRAAFEPHLRAAMDAT